MILNSSLMRPVVSAADAGMLSVYSAFLTSFSTIMCGWMLDLKVTRMMCGDYSEWPGVGLQLGKASVVGSHWCKYD